MAVIQPLRREPEPLPPTPLHLRAVDDLRFIRATMERAASFTAISGRGLFAIGITALVAAALAAGLDRSTGWLVIWLGEAALAFGIAAATVAFKARAAGVPLLAGPGRRLALSFAPPMLVGGVLTVALVRADQLALVPGVWLLVYGTAVVTGGAFSVRTLPVMGSAFIVLGGLAAFTPVEWADAWLALGFGGLHLGFGAWIARKHGG